MIGLLIVSLFFLMITEIRRFIASLVGWGSPGGHHEKRGITHGVWPFIKELYLGGLAALSIILGIKFSYERSKDLRSMCNQCTFFNLGLLRVIR